MRHAALFLILLFAFPLCAQKAEKPRLVLAASHPWPGCILIDPPREMYGPGEWSCPPKGQATVNAKLSDAKTSSIGQSVRISKV